MESQNACKTCHWGKALMMGLTAGFFAGLFIRSRKGEELRAEAKKAAQALQKELNKKWKANECFTKAEYEEMVKEVLGHFQRAKGIAASEMADLEQFFKSQWKEIQKKLVKEGEGEMPKE
ncbi:YtxH domain-containing protein [Candidatus Uhrbacteria bacterium]|nr:YtxH domain-containing protein [Candidatus Uhrbacteria bacterium]